MAISTSHVRRTRLATADAPQPAPAWRQEFDAAVLAEAFPGDWQNPAPPPRYDLLIIGSGAVAVAAAEHAIASGAHVALAADDVLGLDLLADGVPRGAMYRAASQFCQVRRAALAAWPDATLGRLDFEALRREIAAARRQMARRYSAARLAERGVDVYLGPLTFTGPGTLKVAGQSLAFSRALLAPVARPAPSDIDGLEALGYQTPESLGELAELPRRWAILGDSSVACELAQALRRLGSAVDMIMPGEAILPRYERLVRATLQRQMAADGVVFHCGWQCRAAQRTGAAKGLTIERGDERRKLLSDEILVVGRRECQLDWLRLEAGEIRSSGGGVVIDPRLRTSNRRVFSVLPAEVDDMLQSEAVEQLAHRAVRMRSPGVRPAAILAVRRAGCAPIRWCVSWARIPRRLSVCRGSRARPFLSRRTGRPAP